MCWYSRYLQEDGVEQLQQRFRHEHAYLFDDKDDAFSAILETMLEKRLPKAAIRYRGGDNEAYFRWLFDRTVIDVFRQQHGYIRPPLKLREKGPRYKKLFWRHCYGRFSKEEISRLVGLPMASVACCVRWLERERKCPVKRSAVLLTDNDLEERLVEQTRDGEVRRSPVESSAEEDERRELIRSIIHQQANEDDARSSRKPRLKHFVHVLPRPALSDLQFTVLKMHYWEDQPFKGIAKALQRSPRQIGYAHKQALKHMRSFFRSHDIEL